MNKKLLFLAGLAPLVAAPALVVASCSSSTTTDGTTGMTPEETAAATKAIENAKNYLESKSYFFADKKPSEVDLKQIALPALKPSQNLGFSTKYFYDDKNVTNNDETGEKTIRIEVSRGKAKLSNQSAVLKLKSNKVDETDAKTKIDQLINLDPVKDEGTSSSKAKDQKTTVRRATVFVKDYNDSSKAPKASEISNYVKDFDTKRLDLFLKEPSDEKVTSKGVTLGWKSLVKKDQTNLKAENFMVSNVKQTQVGSILAPSITFDLKLNNGEKDDKAKESGIVQVNLVGFQLDQAYASQVQHLLEQAAEQYGALYSPIINDAEAMKKLPSQIKSAADPKKELESVFLADWNIMGGDLIVPITIDVTIEDVVSANDAEGSLTVKFKFERKKMDGEGSTPASTTKEIKLFGFQLAQ